MAHRRGVADYWSRLARQQGYPARSVFKLKELDYKFRLFRPGYRVLDLGCSPGSWTMFAAEKIGHNGFVLGLDLQPLPNSIPLPSHVTLLRQDVLQWKPHPSCHGSFDVVLSDMAPSTSGIKLLDANASHELCEQAIQIAQTVLKPHGTLVMKVFHGSGFAPVLKRVQSCFGQTHTVKPASTRGESVETFIVGRNFKPKGNKNTSDKEKKEKAHASKLATAAQSSNRRGGNQR